jgi:hypothetical protein
MGLHWVLPNDAMASGPDASLVLARPRFGVSHFGYEWTGS